MSLRPYLRLLVDAELTDPNNTHPPNYVALARAWNETLFQHRRIGETEFIHVDSQLRLLNEPRRTRFAEAAFEGYAHDLDVWLAEHDNRRALELFDRYEQKLPPT